MTTITLAQADIAAIQAALQEQLLLQFGDIAAERAAIRAARELIGDHADHPRRGTRHLDPAPARVVDIFRRHGRDDGEQVWIEDPTLCAEIQRAIMGVRRPPPDQWDGMVGGVRWADGCFADVVLEDCEIDFSPTALIVGGPPPIQARMSGFDYDRITAAR